jgi:GT2 family glycosyltransferase
VFAFIPHSSAWYARKGGFVVDIVVVSYNSRAHVRSTVEPLARVPDLKIILVDNDSRDGTVESVRDLQIDVAALATNQGFAHACNVGWRRGTAVYVLFLNPDAKIDPESIRRLVQVLEDDRSAGAVAPKIVDERGTLEFSQRRFPRPISTMSEALYLHRLFPRARWSGELVRDPAAYGAPRTVDWVSGACVLVRRDVLDLVGGWDEGFFLYCEDIDLCKRIGDAGFCVRFEPSAVAVHAGGASAPRAALLPTLAASRVRYAHKHGTQAASLLERIGIGVGAISHLVAGRGGRTVRLGHARSLWVVLRTANSICAKQGLAHDPRRPRARGGRS